MPFQDLFKQVHNLPSIPKVVQELIENFNSDGAKVDDISKKLQMDQSLSLKVLRMANSARYGAGRKVNSIDSAVVLLGFDALKTLVIASGVTSACKTIPGIDQNRFWRCSFTVANIAKLIAKQAKLDGELAFTCGMLHNIGDALMHIAHSDKMARVDSLRIFGKARADVERDQFGYNFMEAGAELVRRWNFPQQICEAILFQGEPAVCSSDSKPYAEIVNIAVQIFHLAESDDAKQDLLTHLPTERLQALDVDLLIFMEKLVELLAQEDDIQSVLNAA